eukprot:scaffold2971_cov274-Pinguiococcus_pyrenoidosus.AAC.11
MAVGTQHDPGHDNHRGHEKLQAVSPRIDANGQRVAQHGDLLHELPRKDQSDVGQHAEQRVPPLRLAHAADLSRRRHKVDAMRSAIAGGSVPTLPHWQIPRTGVRPRRSPRAAQQCPNALGSFAASMVAVPTGCKTPRFGYTRAAKRPKKAVKEARIV